MLTFLFPSHQYVALGSCGGDVWIDELLQLLAEEFSALLYRAHRHALVAIAYIESLQRDNKGDYYLRIASNIEKITNRQTLCSKDSSMEANVVKSADF
jgi:DNA-binding LytR/AlgR family response regulator